jgi:hypothetical protein
MITGRSRARPALTPSPACHPGDTPKITTLPTPWPRKRFGFAKPDELIGHLLQAG